MEPENSLKIQFEAFDWKNVFYDPLHDHIEADTEEDKVELLRLESLLDSWQELYKENPEGALQLASTFWENHPMQSYLEQIRQDDIFSTIKDKVMIERNYDFLSRQLKYTGFGDELNEQLKAKMEKGETEFMLTHQKKFGNDEIAATLHFRKTNEGEMYFFNRYNLMLQNAKHTDPIKQSFYIDANRDNITLKEGYNLLSGRAVYKELSNKENQTYQAWVQLDFKQTDKHGNFKMHPYNEKYGFNLEQALARHEIRELQSPEQKQRLIESLQRGNRHEVTLNVNGQERKIGIEAAPRFKSLNLYEANGVRIRTDKLYETQDQSLKQNLQKSMKQGAASEEGGGITEERTQKKSKRNRQGIH
ncbi:MAG: hypothetical protein WDN26_16585 [Chitinophagaceae bacterium]